MVNIAGDADSKAMQGMAYDRPEDIFES